MQLNQRGTNTLRLAPHMQKEALGLPRPAPVANPLLPLRRIGTSITSYRSLDQQPNTKHEYTAAIPSAVKLYTGKLQLFGTEKS
jgi:hypothetical protein